MKKIGFTTTIPVEIVLSAGHTPVDLNNIFVSDNDPSAFIDDAHSDGLPRNTCSWIKGLYTIGARHKSVDEIIAVTNGDCSNTHALSELFQDAGVPVHTFAYPFGESNPHGSLKKEMEKLAAALGTTLEKATKYAERLAPIREKLKILDELTIEGKISGAENHLWLVSSSDFNGDPEKFSQDLDELIASARLRETAPKSIRIGIIGVPTINPSMYNFIESKNCKIVLNEVERQFAILSKNPDYITRYIEYTYPYGIDGRIADINEQIKTRRIDGIIHYVQSFCYRQIQDVIIRRKLPVPVLTVEGDMPGDIDARTKIRVDSFIEMLEHKKKK